MTPDRTPTTPPDEGDEVALPEPGAFDTTAFDTTAIGIIGGVHTAQVPVSLPGLADIDVDDDVVDDGVPDEEVPAPTSWAAPTPEPTEIVIAETIDEPADAAYPDVDDDSGVETAEVVVAEPDAVTHPAIEPDDTLEEEAPEPVGPDAEGEAVSDVSAGSSPGDSMPATRREAHHTGGLDRVHDVERVHPPQHEVALTSKRLGEIDVSQESPDLLTADRLLNPSRVPRPEPEGRWQHFVYTISGRRINLGDGRRAKARKELDRKIAAPLPGNARFVPVLSRKGGVGKTTVTTLLGMALADARDDRVIAIDANPDRGTLAERIARPSGRTVRDLVRARGEINGYADISAIVTRDETRLDVVASDSDPRVSEAFSDRDYHDVSSLAAHYYSIVLTDTGTGIVHSVMGATLELADQIVVVAGLSVDEARLASETLTWLETNGFAEQVRGAIVVLNTARPGTPLVRPEEVQAHFETRVGSVVRIPYDPQIATGSVITFRDLQPATREAARELAARVVEGLRSLTPAA